MSPSLDSNPSTYRKIYWSKFPLWIGSILIENKSFSELGYPENRESENYWHFKIFTRCCNHLSIQLAGCGTKISDVVLTLRKLLCMLFSKAFWATLLETSSNHCHFGTDCIMDWLCGLPVFFHWVLWSDDLWFQELIMSTLYISLPLQLHRPHKWTTKKRFESTHSIGQSTVSLSEN